MSNITAPNSVTTDNKKGQNSVKVLVRKSHCTVCNSAFLKPRVGKLYCSDSCKQFGYNHKEIKNIELPQTNKAKGQPFKRFSLNDYASFLEMASDLKRYRDLFRRYERFKDQEKEKNIKAQMGIPFNQNQSFYFFSNQLNSGEMDEFQILEHELEMIKNLDPPNLSLEQWSFFKSLFKKLNNEKLFKTICHFSREYIQQLNLKPFGDEKTNEYLVVKKMYLNHCNNIAEGLIRFN